MEKKKILFTAKDLKIGGIEKALVTLLNYLIEEYDITLVLEKKEGELLKQLDYKIKIEEYTPSTNKIVLVRKLLNFMHRLKATKKYKDKFDTSVSFATYSLPGSFIARIASSNPILWCHTDYSVLFNQNVIQIEKFFNDIKYKEFNKLVFVSNAGMKSFLKIFPVMKDKTYQCNNLIDYNHILSLSEKNIEFDKEGKLIFLNVGRHEEKAKKLTRIIEATKRLHEDGYKNFKVIFVGDGENTAQYKTLTNKYNLNDYIIFKGRKENPYPYFRVSDCIILSSDYEGYPVVFLESFIMNKPIITTNVSDYEDVEKGRGIVTSKTTYGIYEAMKKMIEEGYTIENKLDGEKYNNIIKEKLKYIFMKVGSEND